MYLAAHHGPQFSAVPPSPIYITRDRDIISAIQSIPEFQRHIVVVALTEGQLDSFLTSPAAPSSILVTQSDFVASIQSRAILSEFRAQSLEESLEISHKENHNNYRAALQAQERISYLEKELELAQLRFDPSLPTIRELQAQLSRVSSDAAEANEELLILKREREHLIHRLGNLQDEFSDQQEALGDARRNLHFFYDFVTDCRDLAEQLEPDASRERLTDFIDRWKESSAPVCPQLPVLQPPDSPAFLPRSPSPPTHAPSASSPGVDS